MRWLAKTNRHDSDDYLMKEPIEVMEEANDDI